MFKSALDKCDQCEEPLDDCPVRSEIIMAPQKYLVITINIDENEGEYLPRLILPNKLSLNNLFTDNQQIKNLV